MRLVCPVCGTTNRVSEERLQDNPVCGSCRAPLMAAEPVSLDDATLPSFIAGTELPVLVASQVARVSGAVPAGQLVKWVEQHVGRGVA